MIGQIRAAFDAGYIDTDVVRWNEVCEEFN
jgi:hypothetical protein